VTKFQEFCKKNPHGLLEIARQRFNEYYPDLPPKEQKKEFDKQISELFFNKYGSFK